MQNISQVINLNDSGDTNLNFIAIYRTGCSAILVTEKIILHKKNKSKMWNIFSLFLYEAFSRRPILEIIDHQTGRILKHIPQSYYSHSR